MNKLGLEDELHTEAVKEHIALLSEVNLPELNTLEPPDIFYMIEVALDSGAANHVLSREDIPGYAVEESPGSKAGQQFLPAGGKAIDNEGQVNIVMHAPSGEATSSELLSCFQVAKVTRPLLSVSRICSKGTLEVVCKKDAAYIQDTKGNVVAKFEKRGGLYVADVAIRNPMHPSFIGPDM